MSDLQQLPRSASWTDPQHLLMTVLGDYWWDRPEPIPSAALVDLLAEFGTTENAARQAIRRLFVRGFLLRHKSGRSTSYVRPRSADEVTSMRLRRAMRFGASYPEWDGQWTVVVFSVPEQQRDVRGHLRNSLRDLGFALLQEAVWISPRDSSEQAEALIDDLGVATAHVMRAVIRPRDADGLDFVRAFNLEPLAAEYTRFIADFAAHGDAGALAPLRGSPALVLRTRLMSRWVLLRHTDPELPREVLPAEWPRDEARQLFLSIYDSLGEPACRRFSEILGRHDASLAQLATYHLSQDDAR